MLTDSSQLFWQLEFLFFFFQLSFSWLISTFSLCLVSPHTASLPLWEMVSAGPVLKIWCDFMTNFNGYVLREIGKNTRWGNWWSWPLTQYLMHKTLLNLLGYFFFWGGGEWGSVGSSSLFSLRQKLLKHYFCHFSFIVSPLLHHAVMIIHKNTLFCISDFQSVDWMARSFVYKAKDSVLNHKKTSSIFLLLCKRI